MASLPSVKLPRSWVSVSPLILLSVAPILTVDVANAVERSMLMRSVTGTTTAIGKANSEIERSIGFGNEYDTNCGAMRADAPKSVWASADVARAAAAMVTAMIR